jgi:hypothetical protein
MSQFLSRLGVLDAAKEDAIRSEAKETVAEGVREMEAIRQPGRDILFDGVYASGRPYTFDEGLAELEAVERPPEVKPLNAPSKTGDHVDPPANPPQESR